MMLKDYFLIFRAAKGIIAPTSRLGRLLITTTTPPTPLAQSGLQTPIHLGLHFASSKRIIACPQSATLLLKSRISA